MLSSPSNKILSSQEAAKKSTVNECNFLPCDGVLGVAGTDLIAVSLCRKKSIMGKNPEDALVITMLILH